MEYIKSLISDSGNNSMTRFLSLVCVIAACLIALLGLTVGQHTPESLADLCATFLGAGLGAKVWQRSIESNEVASQIESTKAIEASSEQK